MKITKKWHNYLFWEDYQNGMWRTVSGDERKKYLKKPSSSLVTLKSTVHT